MEIVEVRWAFALALELKGRLDITTSSMAQERLLALIEEGHVRLALDLSKLEYISSAGLRVLLVILKKIKSRNGKIVLFGAKDYIKGIFDIGGFSALFPMYASADEALNVFRGASSTARFVTAERQGANCAAYCGETIDIDAVQNETARLAREQGWTCESLLNEDGCELIALSRVSPSARKSIYLSSGMHGDEPAPPLAILNLFWQHQWPSDWNIYICPCLNPRGFRVNQRVNPDGIDLNRDYRDSKSKEIRAHVAWLEKQPSFSVTASLHEDWEASGFYVYQLGQLSADSVTRHILRQVEQICAIDHSSMIDQLPADEGVLDLALHSLQMNEALIDRLGETSTDTIIVRRSNSIWSEPIFLVNRKTQISYTFESASACPLELRVQALTRAVNALFACSHEVPNQ
jgi:murein peptide amidase A